MTTKNEHGGPSAGTLGTFSGVFTPSILTILGMITRNNAWEGAAIKNPK